MKVFQIDTLNKVNVLSENIPSIECDIVGWVASSLICIILTVLIYPYLEDKYQGLVVRNLNFLNIYSKHKITGFWTHKWHVKSDSFYSVNEVKQVQIKQFRKRIFAQYIVLDKFGKIYTYQMIGKVDKDQVITGLWHDVEQGNRYHGCFQLYIDINEQRMNGYWTGVSSEKNIKSDKWEWVRE